MNYSPALNNEAQTEHELLEKMISIGIRLSAEKDTDKLMEMILEESMIITHSDGGSIYIIIEEEEQQKLRFQYTRNTSKDFPFASFTMPLTCTSISGYSAYTGESCRFGSMDETFDKIGVRYNDSFDKSNDYRTVNMLVIPMKNLENDVIGVMQLLNKKNEYDFKFKTMEDYPTHTVPYTENEERVISSLASLTAVLLERNILHAEIENLFKTFTESLVRALDQRDPATAGHSMRVAQYSVRFCMAINETTDGPYKDAYYTPTDLKQIYYASLLHDVGKIGVREHVLLKRNRLSDSEFEALKYRFLFHKNTLMRKIETNTNTPEEKKLYEEMDSIVELIKDVNEKGYVPDEEIEKVSEIAKLEYTDFDGTIKPLISDFELINLSVQKGNLTTEERTMIQMHPAFTFNVLDEISWSKELSDVPEIASAHHEKLSGKGYPYHLEAKDILTESRILAVVDIFDALTAADRPYKPALSIEKSLSILQEESDWGNIDSDLLKIFVDKKVYEVIFEMRKEQEEINKQEEIKKQQEEEQKQKLKEKAEEKAKAIAKEKADAKADSKSETK